MLFVYFLVCFFAFCTQKAKICSIVRLKIQPGQKRTANLQISWATQEAAKRCTDERNPVRSADSLISILLSLWWFSKWFNLFQRGVAVTEQTLSLQQTARMNCAFDLKLRWEEWKKKILYLRNEPWKAKEREIAKKKKKEKEFEEAQGKWRETVKSLLMDLWTRGLSNFLTLIFFFSIIFMPSCEHWELQECTAVVRYF